MARRMPPRTARRNQQRLAAQFDRFLRRGLCALEVDQRHVAGGEEAPIDRTEMAHHAVVGLRHCVAKIDLRRFIEAEVPQTPGGEYQLTGEPQLIQRARPILAAKGAEGFVVLAQQNVLFGAGAWLSRPR